MWETCVQSLGWEDPLEKGNLVFPEHSSILAWRIPWTVDSMGSQRVRDEWATFTFHVCTKGEKHVWHWAAKTVACFWMGKASGTCVGFWIALVGGQCWLEQQRKPSLEHWTDFSFRSSKYGSQRQKATVTQGCSKVLLAYKKNAALQIFTWKSRMRLPQCLGRRCLCAPH